MTPLYDDMRNYKHVNYSLSYRGIWAALARSLDFRDALLQELPR
jgi:hypothetical protein